MWYVIGYILSFFIAIFVEVIFWIGIFGFISLLHPSFLFEERVIYAILLVLALNTWGKWLDFSKKGAKDFVKTVKEQK